MIFKIRIAHWRFTFTFAPVTNVVGVNSNLPNGNHIAMWDFDDMDIIPLKHVLADVQQRFHLPNIYILETGKLNHYIAYCFCDRPWDIVVAIVASTPFIDRNFFKYGVYRGHLTLRVTPKEGRKPKLRYVLHSPFPEGAKIDDLNSWTKYETLADSAPMKKLELNLIGTR